MPVVVRDAVPEDAAAIIDCHRESVQTKAGGHYDAAVLESWSPPADNDRIVKIERDISEGQWITLVAEAGGRVVGFGQVQPETRTLGAVYVRPNDLGRVGSAILDVLLDRCRAADCPFLEMDASVNAEAFYERHGFVILSRGRHKLNTGLMMDCVKMRIDL